MWHQDVVDAPQFGVDLQTEVGQGLGGGLHHVLHLDTLGGHAQQGVSHPLHLRCEGGGHSTLVKKQDQKKYVFTFTFTRTILGFTGAEKNEMDRTCP